MTYTAPDTLAIGHVHLKVTDLERSIAFYRDVLGIELIQRYGRQAAFLSAGGGISPPHRPQHLGIRGCWPRTPAGSGSLPRGFSLS